MPAIHDRVRARVQNEICKVCAFRGRSGECCIPDPEGCGILRNLDEAIAVVRGVNSSKMDPYIDQLREVVCRECRNQDQAGVCHVRNHANCSLDDYFGLLVEIIEDELSKEPGGGRSATA